MASLVAVASLGIAADDAMARGKGKGKGGGSSDSPSLGTCNLNDVNLFSPTLGATSCENYGGNDDVNDFQAFGTSWSYFGKYEVDEGRSEGNFVGLTNPELDGEGEVKGGEWFVEEDLNEIAESFVLVLKAGNYHAAYLFEDLNESVTGGTFNVDGVSPKGRAALSHASIYYLPRTDAPEPPKLPEPTAVLALAVFAGASWKLKQSAHG